MDNDYKTVWLARDITGIVHCFHTRPVYDEASGCWSRGDKMTPAQGKRKSGTGNDRVFASCSEDEYPYIGFRECYELKLVGKFAIEKGDNNE